MLLTILCALALHRIWIYEDIFARLRAWLEKRPLGPVKKALLCPACFGFWSGLLAAVLVRWTPPDWGYLLYGLAAYLPIRISVWASRHASAMAIALATGKPMRTPAAPQEVEAKKAGEGRCVSCEEKRRQAGAQKPRANLILLKTAGAVDEQHWALVSKALQGLGYRVASAGTGRVPTGCSIWDGTPPAASLEESFGMLAIDTGARPTTPLHLSEFLALPTTGERRRFVEQCLARAGVPDAKENV